MFRSLALKERPAETDETVMICPWGRWTIRGAMDNHLALDSTDAVSLRAFG